MRRTAVVIRPLASESVARLVTLLAAPVEEQD
jgi:hypothetical protein